MDGVFGGSVGNVWFVLAIEFDLVVGTVQMVP